MELLIINFNMGSPNAATMVDLLVSRINPSNWSTISLWKMWWAKEKK